MKGKPRRWADQQTAAPRKLQALLGALASFAGASGIACRSQDAIAARVGWSKPTIKRWTDLGRALGLLSTKKRFNPRKGHCDAMVYTLHLDRLVTPLEVARQIKELRFASAQGKSKKPLFEANQNMSKQSSYKKESKNLSREGATEGLAEGGQDDDWFPQRAGRPFPHPRGS